MITAVWAVSMTAVVAADTSVEYGRATAWLGTAITAAALAFAFWFTAAYPKRIHTRATDGA